MMVSLTRALGLALLFCPVSRAFLTITSMLYGILMSELNIAETECGIGRFREPHTMFTMGPCIVIAIFGSLGTP